jgi:hypothetical protein
MYRAWQKFSQLFMEGAALSTGLAEAVFPAPGQT